MNTCPKCQKEGREIAHMARKVAYICECGNVWEITTNDAKNGTMPVL